RRGVLGEERREKCEQIVRVPLRQVPSRVLKRLVPEPHADLRLDQEAVERRDVIVLQVAGQLCEQRLGLGAVAEPVQRASLEHLQLEKLLVPREPGPFEELERLAELELQRQELETPRQLPALYEHVSGVVGAVVGEQ